MGRERSRRDVALARAMYMAARVTGTCAKAAAVWGRRAHVATLKLGWLAHNRTHRSAPDDLFVVSYPKSGTTWLQMILYQLTSGGAMSLPHIRTFSPYLEHDVFGRGKTLADVPAPRILKTHLRYRYVPKGAGRYIYVMRDGLDVAVSFYHHNRKYHQYTRPFREFFDTFVKGEIPPGRWIDHVGEWLDNPDGVNLLVIRYEDLLDDLAASVKRIAEFCDIRVDPAQWPRILRNCSFEFMRQHEATFDPFPWSGSDEDNHFIRRGRAGQWRNYVDEPMLAAFNAQFDRRLATALPSYCHEAIEDAAPIAVPAGVGAGASAARTREVH